MKKTVIHILTLLVVISASIGCNRQKAIPDDELKEVFKELFISNAYVQRSSEIRSDSLDMYLPILKSHGYEINDLVFTIENFSRRKSMKLSDVVDAAITELEEEDKFFQNRVAALDSVSSRARRKYGHIVREDSLIKVTKIPDTAKLRIIIPAELGSYAIRYYYTVDSLDENKSLRTTFTFRDPTGRNTGSTTNWMTAKTRQYYSTEINSKENDSILVVLIGNYPEKNMKKPAMEIDSLRITFLPMAEVALDSLDNELKYKLIIDGYEYYKTTKNSSTLHIHPPRIEEKRGDNSRPEGEDSGN